LFIFYFLFFFDFFLPSTNPFQVHTLYFSYKPIRGDSRGDIKVDMLAFTLDLLHVYIQYLVSNCWWPQWCDVFASN